MSPKHPQARALKAIGVRIFYSHDCNEFGTRITVSARTPAYNYRDGKEYKQYLSRTELQVMPWWLILDFYRSMRSEVLHHMISAIPHRSAT